MNQILPFKYLWAIISAILISMVVSNYMTMSTMVYLSPVITIIFFLTKSIYENKKNAMVSILFSILGIFLLKTTPPIIAGLFIGLCYISDIIIVDHGVNEGCKDFTIWDHKNLIILLLLSAIRMVILGLDALPTTIYNQDNIENHVIITSEHIQQVDLPILIQDETDIKIAYEKKWRYIRTIHCEDTDLECMRQKIELFNQKD